MYAYTVTNQIIGAFLEVGLPFIMRFVDNYKARRNNGNEKKQATTKKVVFEDEKNGNGENKEEVEFLENARREIALPEYGLFTDYSEMVTQFGYIALWSTIWPLAPGRYFLLCFVT
jgi:hypothetical protein